MALDQGQSTGSGRSGALGAYGDNLNFPPGGNRCGPAGDLAWVGQQRAEPGGADSLSPAGVAAAAAKAAGLTALVPPSAVESQTVALGFGQTAQDALGAALSSSATPFAATFAAYQASGWRTTATCARRPRAMPGFL